MKTAEFLVVSLEIVPSSLDSSELMFISNTDIAK